MHYLVIDGNMLCIRSLSHEDISYFFYNIMNLLSDKDQLLFMDNSIEILNDVYNKYFVIYDETNNKIIGTGKIYILYSGDILTVCNIENIIIDEEYKKSILKENLIDYLKNYLIRQYRCVKCNVII